MDVIVKIKKHLYTCSCFVYRPYDSMYWLLAWCTQWWVVNVISILIHSSRIVMSHVELKALKRKCRFSNKSSEDSVINAKSVLELYIAWILYCGEYWIWMPTNRLCLCMKSGRLTHTSKLICPGKLFFNLRTQLTFQITLDNSHEERVWQSDKRV